jgi:molybdopterin-biosynthesis enzyme MoeA-like protein
MTQNFGIIIIGDEILSGKRADKHLPKVIDLLAARGLPLAYAEYLGDDPQRITATLARAFAAARSSGDVVFCTGGIGATPDDHTRQCAAKALGVDLALHPEARRLIEERMHDMAREQGVVFDADRHDNLHRLNMGVFPVGAEIIPNPYNKIPGFSCYVERGDDGRRAGPPQARPVPLGSVGATELTAGIPCQPGPQNRLCRAAGAAAPSGGSNPHAVGARGGIHFLPGFPVMAWPMIEWVLDQHYAHLHQKSAFVEKSIIVKGAMEAKLTPLMLAIEAAHAGVKVFSLPSVDHPEFGRHIELGVKGTPQAVNLAYPELLAGLHQFNLELGPELVR